MDFMWQHTHTRTHTHYVRSLNKYPPGGNATAAWGLAATLQDMRNGVSQFTRAGEQPLAQHFTRPHCEGAGPRNIKEKKPSGILHS